MYLKSKLLNKETDKKIEALIEKMTLEEKIGQLNQVSLSDVGAFNISAEDKLKMFQNGQISEEEYKKSLNDSKRLSENEEAIRKGLVGSYLGIDNPENIKYLQKIAVEQSRLSIPLLIGCDVVHGYKTTFPIPLAESCSFDDELFFETAAAAAKECKRAGINWTFAPMIDISRDARWGRIAESMGQDTYLAKKFAKQKVKGFQGEDLSADDKIAACAKHFIAYGACEGGRDYNTVDISLEKLYEVYLPPFESAVDSGVCTVMTSFNDINGVPMTANKPLLKDLLREKMGFDGVIVSDAGALYQCITQGYSEDKMSVAEQAFSAGVDIDMTSNIYIKYLKDCVKSGKISEKDIDNSVRNILRLKFALGLFENPYRDISNEENRLCDKDNFELAKKSALHSAVLLKNNGILPIDREKYKNITLIGELCDSTDENHGCWSYYSEHRYDVTLKEALEKEGVHYIRAYGVKDICEDELEKAIENSDLIIACLGESADMSGEAHSYADISLSESQKKAVKMLKSSKKPFVAVLYNGRPMCVADVDESACAVLEGWQLGTRMGEALADILFGRFNPCGKLTVNFPYKSGECPSYYNRVETGRPALNDEATWCSKYDDGRVKPIYPFGYGLSYTSFEYGNLSVEVKENEVVATVDIENTGECDGYEIAQLYIKDLFASRIRPVRELKGYKKVFLKVGEKKSVEFTVPFEELEFYDFNLNRILEKGKFKVFVGGNSNADLSAEFELK